MGRDFGFKQIKAIPQRTCVSCRKIFPKSELARLVRDPQGLVEFDPTNKKKGRGAYICKTQQCWKDALGLDRLNNSLKASVPNITAEALKENINSHSQSLAG